MTQETISEAVKFVTSPKIDQWQQGDPANLVGKYYIWRLGHYLESDGSNRSFYLQANGLWHTSNRNGTFDNDVVAQMALDRASSKAVRRHRY